GRTVRVIERVCEVTGDRERDLERQRAARALGELRGIDPIDELEDLKRQTVEQPDIEHRDDVRVIEVTRDLRLVEEARCGAPVTRRIRQHALDRDTTREALLSDRLGLEDLRHAALPQSPGNAVAWLRHSTMR